MNRTGIDGRLGADTRGFTIIELVVSSAILFVVAMAVMSAVVFASTATQMSAVRESALNLANQRIEQARNLPYDNVGVRYSDGTVGDPAGSILTPETVDTRFTVETDVRWARDPSNGRATYKSVTVTVSWNEPRSSSVSLSTSIYGSSNLVNSGDVLIEVLDSDTADPIRRASVTVDPSSGTNRMLYTDSEGQAFFGFVPSGNIGIDVRASGYIVDLSPLEGAQVVNDTLNRFTVFAQRPSTGIVRVVNPAGNAINGATVVLTDLFGQATTLVTGSGGTATFENLLKGHYTISVTAAGRAEGVGVLDISQGGETVTTEITLPDPAPLSVRVVDDVAGGPMAGADVSVRGPSPQTAEIAGSPTTTPSSGEVTFDVAASGTYTIVVQLTGYSTVTRSVVLNAGQSMDVEIRLTAMRQGSLRIHVVDRHGHDVSGEQIWVWNASGTFNTNQLWSDRDGEVVLDGLEPGRYSVRTYRWYSGSFVVNTDVQAGEESVVTVRTR